MGIITLGLAELNYKRRLSLPNFIAKESVKAVPYGKKIVKCGQNTSLIL